LFASIGSLTAIRVTWKPSASASASYEFTMGRDTASITSNVARVYILLLAGGDKKRQERDIAEAKRLASEYEE